MNSIFFTLNFQITKNIEAAVFRDCPYFPCHELDENNFSCLYCYCIYYDTESHEGGCLSQNGTGNWFIYEKDGKTNKVWDCSRCIYPHEKENAKAIFLKQYHANYNKND